MPHEIVCDGTVRPLGDMTDIGDSETGPWGRCHRRGDGAAIMITAAEALRDGRPLLGNLAVIAWGTGALVRTGGTRVEIRWRAACERRPASADMHCRVCFGGFAADETAVVCVCDVVAHVDCDRARLNCPGCGAPREGTVE